MSATPNSAFSGYLPYLTDQFLFDDGIIFFNHGSFGACPRPVFDAYQRWQRELERQPVDFIQRRLEGLLADARTRLGAFVGASPDRLVFVPNATYGINVVARSLKLQPGDEVLGTSHEYGAVNNTWRFTCQAHDARYVTTPINLPVTSPDQVVDALWAGVTERTRVLSISHITSPTALIFPIKPIIDRARQAGIITVIDGAHAPGQIDLALDDLGADYYTGNAHKWLCAPKGAAFLYSAAGPDSLLEPLVVSHGWNTGRSGSRLFDNFSWTGTMDPSAFLSVPAAIDFQEQHDWPAVRAACHALASDLRTAIQDLTGLEPICPDSAQWYGQMFVARLPLDRLEHIRENLWPRYCIEVPVFEREGEAFIRVSIQAYNSPQHAERLIDALAELLRG